MTASEKYEPGDPADEPQLVVVRDDDSEYSGFRVGFSGEFYADTAEIAEIFRQEYALSIAKSVYGAEVANLRAEVERLTAELAAAPANMVTVVAWQRYIAACQRYDREERDEKEPTAVKQKP